MASQTLLASCALTRTPFLARASPSSGGPTSPSSPTVSLSTWATPSHALRASIRTLCGGIGGGTCSFGASFFSSQT
eukprot:CAMPEP_0118634372 /NCGR_PEP_ID=MMETSP0785-20121206/1507_1 /TAXON_ID=91992 /ORGANISM="Bolidomonas pacifica, Strain CCMP 1866" /LENGTH=75 /DNA_ID=CAMNT_0006525333 /DNA_START=200 /DNA_END=423 /DNA_ORIENTATION=+